GALPRPVRGGAGDGAPRASRASDQRSAERVLAPLSRASRGGAPDAARARHLVRRLLSARPQPADGADPEAPGHSGGRPSPRPPALSGSEPRAEHRAGGTRGIAGP